MRFLAVAILAILLGNAAQAQQQPSTMQQLLTAHAGIEGNLAEQLDAAHKQVQQLTAENAALKKQIADAEKAKEKK